MRSHSLSFSSRPTRISTPGGSPSLTSVMDYRRETAPAALIGTGRGSTTRAGGCTVLIIIAYWKTIGPMQLGEIDLCNYPPFEHRVWPTESRSLREASEHLKRLLADESVILRWEQATGTEFQGEQSKAVLCAANEQGPDTNSLGYDRVVLFYGCQPERCWNGSVIKWERTSSSISFGRRG